MTESLWAALTPDSIINSVETVLNTPLTNICIPRNSYINRVYEVESTDKTRYIVKYFRPNRWTKAMIQEEHDYIQHCHQAELPVIPPLSFQNTTLFELNDIHFAIFPKKGGRVVDELDEDLWKQTGRLLGRLHNIGATLTSTNRIKWTPNIASTTHLETLKQTEVIPEDYQKVLEQAVQAFIQKTTPLFESQDLILLHGDCHFGNIIYRPEESLYLVDFDDTCIGPVVQDLWMLLPDETEKAALELQWFKSGYTTFRDFPEQSLELIPALKIMRQIHFAAWCALQAKEPHFKHHFPDWGTTPYWNLLTKDILNFDMPRPHA